MPSELGDLSNLTSLILSSNQLSGTIPAELGDLSNLGGLFLDWNHLSGTIPTELGDLSNLEWLWLYRNQLSGPIPPELGDLSNLRRLYLSNNQLSGAIPTELGSMSNLSWLLLDNNQLTGVIPSELGDLSNLEGLYLSNNQLSGSIPLALGDLSNLKYLFLAGNRLTGCIPAGLLSVADDNPDNDPDHDLAKLGLSLFCDSLLSGLSVSSRSLTPAFDTNHADYEAFEGPALVTVTASTEHDATIIIGIRDERGGPVVHMPDANGSPTGHQDHQVELDLDTGYADVAVVAIVVFVVPEDGMASTYTIWVRPVNPCVAGGAVDDLANTGLISDCETLLAARDTLAGTATLNWSADRPITEWDGVTVQGTPLRVTVLRLSYRELTGSIPPELGDLANLQALFLHANQLTGGIPPELGNLSNLRTLILLDNRLTGELPHGLTRLTALADFVFYHNLGLCAPVDDAFQAWFEDIELVQGSSCAPSDSSEDRAVLVQLYNTTDGDNWTNNANWLSDRPIREWHGVTSDVGGRVNGLYLWRNELRGEIPPELGILANSRDCSSGAIN